MLTKRPTFPPFFSTKLFTLTKKIHEKGRQMHAPTRHAHRGIHELVPLKLLVQSVTLVLIRFRACGCWPYFTEIRLLRERKDLAEDQGPSKLPVPWPSGRPARRKSTAKIRTECQCCTTVTASTAATVGKFSSALIGI